MPITSPTSNVTRTNDLIYTNKNIFLIKKNKTMRLLEKRIQDLECSEMERISIAYRVDVDIDKNTMPYRYIVKKNDIYLFSSDDLGSLEDILYEQKHKNN